MSSTRVSLRVHEPKYALAPVFVVPAFDSVTKEFVIGTDRYKASFVSGNDREQSKYVFTDPNKLGGVVLEDTMEGFRITNGMEFDTSDPAQDMVLKVAMASGFVAKSFKDFNPASQQRMYVHNEETIAQDNSKHADQVLDAMVLIKSKTAKEQRDFAAFSGQDILNLSEERIGGWIKQLALSSPEKVIEGFGHGNFAAIVFVEKLLRHRVLVNRGGAIFNGDVPLGDMDSAILFVRNPKNSTLVSAWRSKLEQLGEEGKKNDDEEHKPKAKSIKE